MPAIIRGIFGGGGKIRDATALPEDVRNGKVFYNNQGKQTGLLDVPELKTLEISLLSEPGKGNFEIPYTSTELSLGETPKGKKTVYFNGGYRVGSFSYSKSYQLKYERIEGIEIDGVYYEFYLPCTSAYSFFGYGRTSGIVYLLFNYDRIYLGENSNYLGNKVKLYYKE